MEETNNLIFTLTAILAIAMTLIAPGFIETEMTEKT